ncbi:MAG: VOC family protein [Pseudomonadota bacterium]
MNRAFTNILTDDVAATAQFYEDILGMTRASDFGWFAILSHPEMPALELGILDQTHDTVPRRLNGRPAGVILTFVVSSVEDIHSQALTMGVEIIDGPTDLAYGQRRLMLRDPAGTAVDISAPIP